MDLNKLTSLIQRGEIISLDRRVTECAQVRTAVITRDDVQHIVFTKAYDGNIMIDAAFSGPYMQPFTGSVTLDDVSAFCAAAQHYEDNH